MAYNLKNFLFIFLELWSDTSSMALSLQCMLQIRIQPGPRGHGEVLQHFQACGKTFQSKF